MRSLLVLCLFIAACGDALDTRDLDVIDFDMSTSAPGGDGGIGCGTSECLIGGDLVCCIDGTVRYCAPASACTAGAPVYCDGPEDCPGAACCQPSGAMTLVCRTQCAGTTICHDDRDCPAALPRCCPDTASGYGGCATGC